MKEILKALSLFLLSSLFLSCASSRVEVKPEKSEIVIQENIDESIQEKKLFSDRVPEFKPDNYSVPRRKKIVKEEQQQTVVSSPTPIVVPITVPYPIVQSSALLDSVARDLSRIAEGYKRSGRDERPLENEKFVVSKVETITDNPKPADPEMIIVLPQSNKYYIQIGAFVSKDNAQAMLRNFKRLYPGVDARIFYEFYLYKVRVAGSEDPQRLNNLLRRIQVNYPDAFITR